MKTVLCYGDSNTHGTIPMKSLADRRRHPPEQRWPNVMAAHLGDGWNVIAEGNPGRTTVYDDPIQGPHRNGMLVLPSMLESHMPVDLVVLKLGTNDCQARFSATAFDIARSVDRLAQIIGQSDTGPDGAPPKVLTIAPPPLTESGGLAEMFTGGAAKSARFGELMAAFAKARGVDFLDAGPLIKVSSVDGVHYEAEAHVTLGAAVAKAVQAIL